VSREVLFLDRRPLIRYVVFGIGETHLKRLAHQPRREPTWEELQVFARSYQKPVVTRHSVWVMEVDATPDGMLQLWNADPSLLSYYAPEVSDERHSDTADHQAVHHRVV
jgi:hypothetical protein